MSLVEFWYNSSYHSTLGRSPFEVLYGYPPRHIGLDVSSAAPVPELSQWLEERELMHRLVQQHLLHAQDRRKKQADKFRSEHQFAVGDLVYLKLQPYIQSSVSKRAHQKLVFKFFGPYHVLNMSANWIIVWSFLLLHQSIRCSMFPSSNSMPGTRL